MDRESKAARVAGLIRASIYSEGLASGHLLGTKKSLGEHFTVSPGTINESLRILQAEGLIELRPGPKGGAFVAETADRRRMSSGIFESLDDGGEVAGRFKLQDLLQVTVVADAAALHDEAGAERIRAAVAGLDTASGTVETLKAIWEVDRQIALSAGLTPVAIAYAENLDRLQMLVQLALIQRAASPETIALHRDLAQAVLNRDVDWAIRLARRHSPIDYTMEAMARRASK